MIFRRLDKINLVHFKILLIGHNMVIFNAKKISEILSKSPRIVSRQIGILEKSKLIRLIKKNKIKNRKDFEVTLEGQIKIKLYLKYLHNYYKNINYSMQKNLNIMIFHDLGVSLYSKMFFENYNAVFANFSKLKNKGYLNYNKIRKLNQNRYFLTKKGEEAIFKLRKYILNVMENKEIKKDFFDIMGGKLE